MADIVFDLPAQILFGLDTSNRIGSVLSGLGTRALLVTEAILYEQNIIERIQDLLRRKGIDTIVYDEVVPNATSTCVDDGVKLARSAHIDIVVGLGGIRALSTAKCIAMTTPESSSFDDYLSGKDPQGTPLTYLEVPTTCRNPFMMVDRYIMVDARNRKAQIGRTQRGLTKFVLIDPKLSLTLPAKYTATTMLDTLMSSMEGFLSTRANFFSDSLFTTAIAIIGKSVRVAVEDLEGARFRLDASRAGFLSGMGLTMSEFGVGTALAYAINARFMVPKSWVATILIPHVLEFNAKGSPEKLVALGQLMGEIPEELPTVEAASRTIESIRDLIASLGLPNRLRDFDLNLDGMLEAVETAHSFDMINYLPRTASIEDMYDIVKAAF